LRLRLGAVDDDAGILYTLEAMARSQGWDIRTTSEPEEALTWVRSDLVDILLVDFHMPAMSGLQLVRKAREISGTVVLLVLTVEEDPEVARDLILAGADDFVSKPLRLADFAARMGLHGKLNRFRREGRRDRPRKGIAEDTLRKVLEKVLSSPGPLDARGIASETGLAYPTVHRYLEYLVELGQLVRQQEQIDGKPGRPRSFYEKSTPQD
jgi:DNA-binding response OmpR family regulator